MNNSPNLIMWSAATRNSIESEVTQNFPNDAHKWPVIRTYNSEGYIWNSSHLIIILRNKLTGIAVIGACNVLDPNQAPEQPPSPDNISIWHEFIQMHLDLKPQDAAMVIPIPDASRKVEEEWESWNENDKLLWHKQIAINLNRQFYYVKGFDVTGEFFLPPGYLHLADECSRFFADHPNYESNVFIMTRFDSGNRLLVQLDNELRKVLRANNLNPVRADDKMYFRDRNLWNNVCVYMLCCATGIAILEDRVADEFNPNVALEYGFMRALNKPALLLADTGFRNLRADIIGTLREHFDITDIKNTIKSPIETWLRELGKI